MGSLKTQVVFHAQTTTLCHRCHRWFKSHRELKSQEQRLWRLVLGQPLGNWIGSSCAPSLDFHGTEASISLPPYVSRSGCSSVPLPLPPGRVFSQETDTEKWITSVSRHVGMHAHMHAWVHRHARRCTHAHTDKHGHARMRTFPPWPLWPFLFS